MQDINYVKIFEAGVRIYSNVGKVSLIGDLNARAGSKSDIITDSHIFEKYIPTIENESGKDDFEVTFERASMDNICYSFS